GLDFYMHDKSHVFRASQEGIAYAFRYGLDIIRENGIDPTIIRAGMANMFQSEIFTEIFVNVTGVPVELYNNDGSVGAALGAGIGAGVFGKPKEAVRHRNMQKTVGPQIDSPYTSLYQEWKPVLMDS